MNVYQLRPKGCYCGGIALVAAPTFANAKIEYISNGYYGEMYFDGEFGFDDKFSEPIEGLEWHGGQRIITESIYFVNIKFSFF